MSATRRRARRPIHRGESPKAGLALIKVMISGVVLTIILSQRCAEEPSESSDMNRRAQGSTSSSTERSMEGSTPSSSGHNSTEGSWIHNLIIPSELELPKSVLDRGDRGATKDSVGSADVPAGQLPSPPTTQILAPQDPVPPAPTPQVPITPNASSVAPPE